MQRPPAPLPQQAAPRRPPILCNVARIVPKRTHKRVELTTQHAVVPRLAFVRPPEHCIARVALRARWEQDRLEEGWLGRVADEASLWLAQLLEPL